MNPLIYKKKDYTAYGLILVFLAVCILIRIFF